jgi:hypothetical protein
MVYPATTDELISTPSLVPQSRRLVHSEPVTWAEISKAEPRLLKLFRIVKAINPRQRKYCATEYWYGGYADLGLKHQLDALVGSGAWSRNPRLRSRIAHELAQRKLKNALPPCRVSCPCRKGSRYGSR